MRINMIHSIRHWLCFALTICLLGACSEEIKSEVIPEEWITLITDDMTFAYEGGVDNRTFKLADGIDASSLTVSFSSNGEQWLTATLQNDAIQILCERSFTERGRSSVLTLAYDDNHKSSFTIRQDAAPDAADQLIRVVSAEATSEEADEYVIEKSFDGNKSTYYNSKFGAVSYPFYLTYTLEEGHTLNSIVYTPRTDSGNKWGSFDEFYVEVLAGDDTEFQKVVDFARGDGVHTPLTIKLPTGIVDVRKVRFVITKSYQDRVSCAEMEFFQASEYKFDPSNYFADEMGLQLKEGVTEKQLNQLPNNYLRQLGLALLAGDYDTSYRLAEYRPYQDPAVMAKVNKTSKYCQRDNPTGIYASVGDKLAVFVGPIYQGGHIYLNIQNLNNGYNSQKTYELYEGYNEVEMENSGLIYIFNHTEDDIPLSEEDATDAQKAIIRDKTVQIHFAHGKVQGYFDVRKNKEEDWPAIRDNAPYQDIDVIGRRALITWRVEDFKKYDTEITRSIENFDRLVALEQEFMGLEKYTDKQFNNRMHFCIDYQAASPNASDYRTVYNDGDYYAEPFCDPDRFAARCWGPAHEAGHCNQTRPGLKWAGLTEVTNNIMSLYVQTQLGQPCKLLVDGCTPKDEEGNSLGTFASIYEGAAKLIVEGKRPHSLPGVKNIVRETQLVPFWQLKLYMVDVLGKKDFYHDLYEYFRTHESPSERGQNAGLDQLDFVRQVCAISRLNMLDFFEKWGFLYPVNTTLNDYGNKDFVITQEQIDALKEEIEAKIYAMPHANVHEITEDNLNSYK